MWVGRPCLPAGFPRSQNSQPIVPSMAGSTAKMCDAGIKPRLLHFVLTTWNEAIHIVYSGFVALGICFALQYNNSQQKCHPIH